MAPTENYTTTELKSLREVFTQIKDIYPFLDKEEHNKFVSEASVILEDNNTGDVEKAKKILGLLDNPHAGMALSRKLLLPKGYRLEEQEITKPFFQMIDNVMYLKIASLSGIEFDDLEKPFLEHRENSEGLIIDMRFNTGGQEFPARRFISQYLAKTGEHLVGTNITRDVALTVDKDEIFIKGTKNPYDKPIAVLINEDTFSSAERFVSAIRASTGCVTIGTETKGGSGNPQEFTVNLEGEKYFILIPTWRFFLPGETEALEKTKIVPDVPYHGENIVDFAVSYIKDTGINQKIV